MNLQTADTLARMVVRPTDADTLLTQGTQTEFFGADAVLSLPSQVVSVVGRPIEEPLFKILTVVMLLVYLYVIYVYSDEIRSLFKSSFSFQESDDSLVGDDVSFAFVIPMSITGWLAMALFVTNYMWLEGFSDSIVPTEWLPPFMIAIFALWNFYNWLLLKLSGDMTRNDRLSRGLLTDKCRLFAVFTTFAVPLILFAVFGSVATCHIAHILFVVLVSLYFIIYFFKTLHLFVKEKISILFWILYLCTVDIMPIVTVVVLMLNIR